MNIKQLRNLIKMSIPMLALFASSVFYTSCGDKDNDPQPNPPIEKLQKHLISINGIEGLVSQLPDIQSKSAVTKDSMLITISNSFAVKASDFSNLDEFSQILKRPNVKINWSGNGTYSDEEKLALSSENATVLSNILKSGAIILYNPKTNSMFWINSSDENKFKAEDLRYMGRIGARDFVISNTAQFEEQIQAAINHANSGEKAMIKIENAQISASKSHYIKNLLNNPNASFYPTTNFSVVADQHPTPKTDLNALYDWNHGEIKLILKKNPNALAKENHIMADDSTMNILKTRATANKKTGFLKTYDENGNLTDPVIGTYLVDTYVDRYNIEKPVPGMSVDGIPLQELDIKNLVFGIEDKENGSGYIMDASARKVSNVTKANLKFYYPTINGGVKIILSANEEYNHLYEYSNVPNEKINSPNISMLEIHPDVVTLEPSFFQKIIYDVTHNKKEISFSGGAVSFLITNEDHEKRWNFGIQGSNFDKTNSLLKKKLTDEMGISVPASQYIFYISEHSMKKKLLPLSLYNER